MKKRLFSLFLCILMIVTVCTAFTSCSEEGNEADDRVIRPMTITLAMITDEETTPEGIQLVQDAINKTTEKTYNTHVVLQLYTEKEYNTEIAKKIQGRLYDQENNITKISMGSDTDVVLNEYGREITVYPEPYENQIDIFMISDGTKFIEYYRQGALEDVSSTFTTSTAALLSKYVSPDVLKYGKIGEGQYGIPSSSFYGEHEYLLINKELFDKYNYDIDSVSADLTSIEDYLVDLAKYEHDNGVIPLYNVNEMGLESLTGGPSVVSSYIPEGAYIDPDTSYTPGNILAIEQVRKYITTVHNFASINGDYPTFTRNVDFTKKFGAAYLKGSSLIPQEYEKDYYVLKFRGPVVETSEVYSSMFGVSPFSTDTDRCMEIVTLINTNESIRNILQYGIENVHYTRDEDTGIVTRIKNPKDGVNYSMDMYKTGNLFLVWPNSEMSETEIMYSANKWALAKQASIDAFFSPNVGFKLNYDTVDYLAEKPDVITVKEDIEQLALLYEELWVKIAEYNDYVNLNTGDPEPDFSSYLDYLSKWLTSNPYVTYAQSSRASDVYNIAKQYRNWYSLAVVPDPAE